jgi:hypothetical protein
LLITVWALLPARYRANDSTDYWEFYAPVAHNLLAGRGLTLAEAPAVLYPPGYPALLALAFLGARGLSWPAELGAQAISLMAHMLSVGLLYQLAEQVWAKWAWLPALLWATYPLGLWLAKQPNSEGPFLVVLLSALWMLGPVLIQPRPDKTTPLFRVLGAGMLLGAAGLLRPIALGVGVVLAALLCFRAPGWWRLGFATTLLFGNALAVLPWEWWAYTQTGQVIPLSTNGPISMRGGLLFAVDSKGYRTALPVPAEARQVMLGFIPLRDRGTTITISEITQALKAQWHTHPLGVAQLYALKAARSWYATDSGRFEGWILALQAMYLTAIGLSAWRAWRLGGAAHWLVMLVLALTLYFWGMTIVALSIVRYMTPVMALLFLLTPALLRPAPSAPSHA